MRRWILVAAAIAALGGLIGWRIKQKNADAAEQTKTRQARMKSAPSVSVAKAAIKDIVQTFAAVGSAEAPLSVKIAPKVTGRIEYLEVHEGDPVRIGQVLVRLDPIELRAQLREQEASLAQARARLAQARITQSPTDTQVSTQIKQQEAAVASAQADVRRAEQGSAASQAAAEASVTDYQGRLRSAETAIANSSASIRSAQANLENARAKLARAQTLFKKGFVSEQDVDDARTAVKVQESAVEVAQGQAAAATAQRDSASANVKAAQEQLSVTKTKNVADIASAQAGLEQAHAALRYAQANRAQTPAYRENLAALSAAVDVAQSSANAARAQLSYTVLTSPVNGYVTSRAMDPGAIASTGAAVLTVEAIRQIWVSVAVPEEVTRSIVLGQTGAVAFDAIPGREFTGRVVQMNPSGDSLSRQFTVRVALDNPRGELKPGMFARVTFETQRSRGAVVVPREAIQRGKDGPTVVVVGADMKAQRRPVTLGAADAADIAVTSGVAAGEQVVTLSSNPPKDGQQVRVGGAGGPGKGGNRPGAAR